MSAGDLYFLGDNGLPEMFVERAVFVATSQRIASLIAASSRDPDIILAIMARELQDESMFESYRTALSHDVLFQLTIGILGPFMDLAEVTYPQNDYVGDLLALTIPENQSLQGGFESSEGDSPSEGEPHV